MAKGVVVAPGAFNALSAKLIEKQGFPAVYVSGAGLSNGAYGWPDVGRMSLPELLAAAKAICRSVKVPALVDADTGYGRVDQTVRGLERLGAAGFHLEDQQFPKRCGHLPGKTLVAAAEMGKKIKAAVRAKKDPDFLIVARTDARGVEGFDAAVERSLLYRKAGADVIFPEALRSEQEFKEFARRVSGPLVANMTEFGQTPSLRTEQFEQWGYRMVIFPMTLLRASLHTMRKVLTELKTQGTPKAYLKNMMTRQELYELLDYQF